MSFPPPSFSSRKEQDPGCIFFFQDPLFFALDEAGLKNRAFLLVSNKKVFPPQKKPPEKDFLKAGLVSSKRKISKTFARL